MRGRFAEEDGEQRVVRGMSREKGGGGAKEGSEQRGG